MTNVHVRVWGRFDASRAGEATVTIERKLRLIHVRPYRRRRRYTLPLTDVAEYVVHRVIRAEITEKHRVRWTRRRGK